jgi:hypothetical protein
MGRAPAGWYRIGLEHRRCSGIYEQRFPTATGVPGAHPVAKRSVQRVYFFGGETLRSFVTLTTPSVSFASRSASALACSFGTVPFR